MRLSLAGAGLVAVSAAAAIVERIRKGSVSAAPRLRPDPAPLRDAAELAYDYAREHRLPIAAAAERRKPDDAVGWFENSLLKTVPVSAVCVKTGKITRLDSLRRARMCAVSGGIAETDDSDALFVDPTVRARHFKAYLRWARSVW